MRMGSCILLMMALSSPLLHAQSKSSKAAASIKPPITGESVASMKAFDDAVLAFMAEIEAPAATLAVARNGQIVLSRGYGWRDAVKQQPTQPETPMRIASVSKPITASLVRTLVREGKLKLETPVFPLLAIAPPPGATVDERVKLITVEHLLGHKGGWDRDAGFDPMFADMRVMSALKMTRTPAAIDIIRYMLTQPLDFDPGSKSAYSNFGYCVLGRVIEKSTGMSYENYAAATLFKPLGMTHTRVGRTMLKDRPAEEAWYNQPDGATKMERMDAPGGLVSSAPDLCRWMKAYWISGEPRRGWRGYSYTFFGSLPSCTAMIRQLPDGTDIAVLLNHRRKEYKADNEKLRKLMDEAAGVK